MHSISKISRVRLGQRAEGLALEYLESKGYQLIQQNFRCQLGEIDIIAKDGDCVCFIEIRSRSLKLYGVPEESITPLKQRRLTRVALAYLKSNRLTDVNIRFDVVSILFDGRYPDISLVKGAFECENRYLY